MRGAFVLLQAGSEESEVRGRTAVILGELNLLQEKINSIPVGRLIVHFAYGQLKVECTESTEAIRFEDDLDP